MLRVIEEISIWFILSLSLARFPFTGEDCSKAVMAYHDVVREMPKGADYKIVSILEDEYPQLLIDAHAFVSLYGFKDGRLKTIIERLPYGMGGRDYYKYSYTYDRKVILMGTDYDYGGKICTYDFYYLCIDGLIPLNPSVLIRNDYKSNDWFSSYFEDLYVNCKEYVKLTCDKEDEDGF